MDYYDIDLTDTKAIDEELAKGFKKKTKKEC